MRAGALICALLSVAACDRGEGDYEHCEVDDDCAGERRCVALAGGTFCARPCTDSDECTRLGEGAYCARFGYCLLPCDDTMRNCPGAARCNVDAGTGVCDVPFPPPE